MGLWLRLAQTARLSKASLRQFFIGQEVPMRNTLYRFLSLAAIVSFVLVGLNAHSTLAAAHDRFRPSSATTAGEADDALRTPLEFEEAAAEHPDANSLILFSQCRFAPFSGNPSFYSPLAAGTSDAIVGDTTFPLAGGTHCYNPQNESNIVVNPTNPNNVLTSANEYRIDGDAVYVSMDAGQTWTDVFLPGRTAATGGSGVFARLSSCGDPVLAFGPDGTAYYAGLGCNVKNAAFFSGLSVSASHDGGQTWGAPVMVSFSDSPVIFNDKEFMTVGADGKIYVTWTRFKVAKARFVQSPIVLSVSKNGGRTWSSWVNVSDSSHPYNQGSMPLVAPDGTLYVAYEGATPGTGYAGDAIIVARSSNGGKTFTNAEVARAFDDNNCYPRNVAQNRQTLSGEEFRINSFPSFAIDPTNGQLVIVWADDEANASCGYEKGGSFVGPTSNQVKLITSSDGVNWSASTVITTGVEDKVYPAVGANNGRIVVGYYTRAYSPITDDCRAALLDTVTNAITYIGGPVCLDFAMRTSDDGFASETRLTNESSNPYITFAGSFIGDYNGAVVGDDGAAYLVWADFRGNPGVTDPNMDTDVAYGQ
jgi:hypothetical protein